jgi:hypothetical protein
MSYNHRAHLDRDNRLENYAAQLTRAVYPLALVHGLKDSGSWIKLELGLWKALTKTVQKWARKQPSAASAGAFDTWREGLLVELTETAFSVAVRNGIQGPFLEVELDFYRAFRLMIRRRSGGC